MERRFFEKGIAGGSLCEGPPRAAGGRADGRRRRRARFHLRRNPRSSRRTGAPGLRRRAGARRGGSLSYLQRNLQSESTLEWRALDAARAGISERIAASLRERIEKLAAGIPLDEARLAQEVAQLADRADITEEIDRLKTHLAEARRLLAADGAVGRRLDHLAQELHREVNTSGSKVREAGATKLVLDLKSELEAFKEQVQNVE